MLGAALLLAPIFLQAPVESSSWHLRWNGSIDIGLTSLSGNNESATGTARAEARLEQDGYRWLLGAQYSGVRQTDLSSGIANTTSRLYTAFVEHHRTFDESDDFYAYGKGSGRSDRPNGLQGRTDGGIGIGYTVHFFDDNATLSLEAGPSMVWENNVGIVPTSTWTSRFAVNLDSKLNTDIRLTTKAEYFRSVESAENASAIGEIGLRWTLKNTWFLQLSSSFAWDSTPAPGFENSDYRQSLTIGITF